MADDTREVDPVTHPGMFSGNIPKAATVFTLVTVPDNASATTVYSIARIPSNARILPGSFVTNTDMETASADPEFDIGLKAVASNITTDADALNVDLSMDTAAQHDMVSAPTLWGLPAWDYVSGQTSDPGGFLDVTITITDHDATEPGTFSCALVYATD